MAVSDAYVFPGFLTPVLTQLFFPKPLTTFLTCFCRGERRKYAGKKSPQLGIKLATTRSWVRHAHHWATRAGWLSTFYANYQFFTLAPLTNATPVLSKHRFTQGFLYFKWQFNLFPNKPWFLRVGSTSLLKTMWEKEKLLETSNFSFSHSVFYLLGELSAIFNKFEIVICKLFQFWRV